MKLVELRNTTGSRIVVPQVRGMVVDAGQVVKVHPATVSHPAVARYIKKRALVPVEPEIKAADVAPPPKAPSKPVEPMPKAVEKKEEPKVPEPPAVVEEPGVEEEKKADEPAGPDMKALYLAAPGITEENIEAVFAKFPTPKHIAMASKSDLVDCGIARTFISRLRTWAGEQEGVNV